MDKYKEIWSKPRKFGASIKNHTNMSEVICYADGTDYAKSLVGTGEVLNTFKKKMKRNNRNLKHTDKGRYYALVWEITEQNAHKVSDNHLRGKDYHLDHILPISYGWKHKIAPEIIGRFDNLRIISKKLNFKKAAIYNGKPPKPMQTKLSFLD